MTTVFLSGSRRIGRLNDLVRKRIDNIIEKKFDVIIGDANGADKALQTHLAKRDYRNVNVYFVGKSSRNNVGDWPTKNIKTDKNMKGRDYYTQKDIAMVEDADFGLVIWDGKSIGSINNAFRLISSNKCVVVFHSPSKSFYNIKNILDLHDLVKLCAHTDYISITKYIGRLNGSTSLQTNQSQTKNQGEFNF